LHAMSRARKRV